MLTVIGFYTRGTPYEADAARLKASLDRVGMDSSIIPIETQGDWDANVARKCSIIHAARQMVPGPLLYLDVDAVVHENCTEYFERLCRAGIDFAAHWFQGPEGGYDCNRNDDHFLSGTMLFGESSAAWELLGQWARENTRQIMRGNIQGQGQANLRTVLDEKRVAKLKVQRLPGRYCRVFDKPWAYPPDEPVIIEHLIASRENRGTSAGEINAARRKRIEEIDAGLGAAAGRAT